MNDFFSKYRRGEDGDASVAMILMGMVIIVFVLIGVFFYQVSAQAEEREAKGETASSPHERNVNWVTNTGRAIEEWVVSNPKKGLPATEDYVLYDEYKANIVKGDDSFPVGDKTYIRVVSSANNDGSFTVCGYYSPRKDVALDDMDIYAFDSATGNADHQTRGVCLL